MTSKFASISHRKKESRRNRRKAVSPSGSIPNNRITMEAQFDASFGPMSDATAEISAAIHRIMGDDPFEKAAVSHARQFSLFNGILHNGHRTPVRTESNRDLLREEAPSTRRIPRWCGCDAFCFFARGGSAFRWSR
ncbi:hypothetical protein MTP99_011476 [Tenebrio molitor]|jgi:hypothetical protein|nr:hypothetical protein MTP99_011476 [Tenebrio molitor]